MTPTKSNVESLVGLTLALIGAWTGDETHSISSVCWSARAYAGKSRATGTGGGLPSTGLPFLEGFQGPQNSYPIEPDRTPDLDPRNNSPADQICNVSGREPKKPSQFLGGQQSFRFGAHFAPPFFSSNLSKPCPSSHWIR